MPQSSPTLYSSGIAPTGKTSFDATQNNVVVTAHFFDPALIRPVHDFIAGVCVRNNISFLAPTLSSLATELFRHSVTRSYRYAFMKYMVTEMGLSGSPADELEELFHSELQSSRSSNFVDLCQENNIEAVLSCSTDGNNIQISTNHSGRLDPSMAKKIQQNIRDMETLKEEKNLHQLARNKGILSRFDNGLSMALFTFRGLGIPYENFRISNQGGSVSYTVTIPVEIFRPTSTEIAVSNDPGIVKNLIWEIFDQLEFATVIFSPHGKVVEVSGQLLDILNLSPEESGVFRSLIPDKFFEDIFISPFGVHNFSLFENYRITVPVNAKNLDCLFNVSGIKSKDGNISTLWQAVNIDKKNDNFSKGSLFENLNILKLLSPYIPKMVLEKARTTLSRGLSALPIESEDATIFFADLAGFTHVSETMNHQQIVELLNLIMSTIVTSIERHGGYVDKFIGDGVMCIFFDPLSAVIAGVEIQNNLINLNEFRAISGQPLLEMRIGINSGKVILGSIGTKERMDWTALGDVVNTASRIESSTPVNNVGISETTYELIRLNVMIKSFSTFKLKGKEKEQTILFVDSVNFYRDGQKITLELINPEA